ncbi:MAG: MopE-related protein [Myxococcota bacterium]
MRIVPSASLVLFAALVGCPGGDDGKPDSAGVDSAATDTWVTVDDPDLDGVTEADGDCEPDNAEVYPGRAEDCNGADDNCNGVVDEGLPDADEDGTADCQDEESCDGVDNDGDGDIDEGFADGDSDGVPDCLGTEICDGADNDADGEVDEGFDGDGDGYASCGEALDCDDGDASVNPGENENTSDRVDNDCDGLVDERSWASGDLAITEIMNNPGQVADPDGEWFEVYNTTDRTLILNGLVISDSSGESHQVTSDDLLELDPGDFFVFGSNAVESSNGDVEVDYAYVDAWGSPELTLSNESDSIMLYAGTVLVDEVTWDDGVTMPDAVGASMGLDLGNYSSTVNDDPTAWCEARIDWVGNPSTDKGSPGADNEYCSTFDHDGDGFNYDEGDCDETDSTTYPGAPEGTDPADNDCDGDEETQPVAVASSTGAYETCDDLTLDGTGSYDLEGATLTYSWELTGAPSGSALTTSDIDTSSSAAPTFTPDVAGDYTFTLTVNDGGTDSTPVSLTVTITDPLTNEAPVANAGADQSGSGTGTCTPISYGASYSCDDCSSSTYTLDASGSTDADGHDMEYSWSVISGSSYGSLSSSTGSSVTLTISGVGATYATATTETVTVEVTATDCMGATSTDTVAVAYTCTGA